LAELTRLRSFRSARRRRDWLAGRLAAKRLIIDWHGHLPDLRPAEVEIAYGPSGEPRAIVRGEPLGGISISIAHSFGHGLAGLSEPQTEGRIGVDIERICPVNPKLKGRILGVEELEEFEARFAGSINEGLILYWTLKEAAVKALRPAMPPRMDELCIRLAACRKRQAQISLPKRSLTLEAGYQKVDGFYLAFALAPI